MDFGDRPRDLRIADTLGRRATTRLRGATIAQGQTHRIDARTDPEKARQETIDWIKRLRDMRRLAVTKAPGVFLPPPPRDFVGRAEALETLYALLAEDDPGSALLYG